MTEQRLVEEAGRLETLRSLLDWCLARTPRAEIEEVIDQDEFTFDVVVRVSADAYLAFDST